MKPAAQLSHFVQDGLRAGHTREELQAALHAAGWSAREIDTALAEWSDSTLRLPVPRPGKSVSGRDIMLYGLMAAALLAITWHLVQLCFALIDMWLEAPESSLYINASALRWSVSTLIVVGPLFVWLHLRSAKLSRDDPSHRRTPLRGQLGAIAMFLAALVLLGDAITVVFALLDGEMTTQFLARALVVAVVTGLVVLWGRAFLSKA